MGEIGLDVEIKHSADRVWAALTDRELLRVWFMENDFDPKVEHRFTFWPGADLPGLDNPISAVVVALEPPRRLIMAWRSGGIHTEMTWWVEPRRTGSLLRIREFGAGPTSTDDPRGKAYALLFGERLPSLLELQAAAEHRRPVVDWLSARAGEMARLTAGVVVAVVLAVAVWLVVPHGSGEPAELAGAGPGQLGLAPGQTGSATTASDQDGSFPGSPRVSASASPSATPSGVLGSGSVTLTAGGVAEEAAAVLSARYSVGTGVNHRVTVVITNPGTTAVSGWTVAMRFSGVQLGVTDVTGADHVYKSGDHFFTPTDQTRTVPQAGSVSFSFDFSTLLVSADTVIRACAIDGDTTRCTAG